MGHIMGTAAYMAPEQARGKPVDRRADIWAFGALLYQMLAGVRPFPGETVSDTLAAVLTSTPDWTRLPRETPGSIRTLLARCLEKDPRQRLQAIGEARIALSAPPAPADGDGRKPASRALIAAIAGGALVLGALGGAACTEQTLDDRHDEQRSKIRFDARRTRRQHRQRSLAVA